MNQSQPIRLDDLAVDPVGTWTLTEARTTGCIKPANRLKFVTTDEGVCATQGGGCIDATLVFKASGTLFIDDQNNDCFRKFHSV